jgi:hypothetical protein
VRSGAALNMNAILHENRSHYYYRVTLLHVRQAAAPFLLILGPLEP